MNDSRTCLTVNDTTIATCEPSLAISGTTSSGASLAFQGIKAGMDFTPVDQHGQRQIAIVHQVDGSPWRNTAVPGTKTGKQLLLPGRPDYSSEIDNTARKLAGMSPQSGVYGLMDMQRDLEQMLAVEGKALDSDDIWYLQNFSHNDSAGRWQFDRKPVEKRRDMLASDNDSPTTSPGGGDDDDE